MPPVPVCAHGLLDMERTEWLELMAVGIFALLVRDDCLPPLPSVPPRIVAESLGGWRREVLHVVTQQMSLSYPPSPPRWLEVQELAFLSLPCPRGAARGCVRSQSLRFGKLAAFMGLPRDSWPLNHTSSFQLGTLLPQFGCLQTCG